MKNSKNRQFQIGDLVQPHWNNEKLGIVVCANDPRGTIDIRWWYGEDEVEFSPGGTWIQHDLPSSLVTIARKKKEKK